MVLSVFAVMYQRLMMASTMDGTDIMRLHFGYLMAVVVYLTYAMQVIIQWSIH